MIFSMKNSGSQHPTLTPTRLSDVGLMPIHTHGVSRENVTPYTTRCEQQQKKKGWKYQTAVMGFLHGFPQQILMSNCLI